MTPETRTMLGWKLLLSIFMTKLEMVWGNLNYMRVRHSIKILVILFLCGYLPQCDIMIIVDDHTITRSMVLVDQYFAYENN